VLINTLRGEMFKNKLEKIIDETGINEYLGLPTEIVAMYITEIVDTFGKIRTQEDEYYTKINARLALIMGEETDARETGLSSAEPSAKI
jgi:hypothetical protein